MVTANDCLNGAEQVGTHTSIADTVLIKFIVDNPERAKLFAENIIAEKAFNLLRQAAKLIGNLYHEDFQEKEDQLAHQVLQYLETCLEHAFSPKKALAKLAKSPFFTTKRASSFELLTHTICCSLAVYDKELDNEVRHDLLDKAKSYWSELQLINLEQSKKGKQSRKDALSQVIYDIAHQNPKISAIELLKELYELRSQGVIDDIDEFDQNQDIRSSLGCIHYSHNNKSYTAPISGLPDRLRRAKLKKSR